MKNAQGVTVTLRPSPDETLRQFLDRAMAVRDLTLPKLAKALTATDGKDVASWTRTLRRWRKHSPAIYRENADRLSEVLDADFSAFSGEARRNPRPEEIAQEALQEVARLRARIEALEEALEEARPDDPGRP